MSSSYDIKKEGLKNLDLMELRKKTLERKELLLLETLTFKTTPHLNYMNNMVCNKIIENLLDRIVTAKFKGEFTCELGFATIEYKNSFGLSKIIINHNMDMIYGIIPKDLKVFIDDEVKFMAPLSCGYEYITLIFDWI